MVLICFHLVNFRTHKTFPFSDLHQDILAHRYQFYFYRDSKHNVERFSWTHNFQFIDAFSTQNLLLFFNLLLVPLYNLRNWYGNIILFIYLILFFITTRTFVKFIFHSKFIEPSINTHIVKHCDGINMFSSSEFSHTQHFSIFWFISRFFGTSISILFLQRFKTQSRENTIFSFYWHFLNQNLSFLWIHNSQFMKTSFITEFIIFLSSLGSFITSVIVLT